MGVTSVPEVIK